MKKLIFIITFLLTIVYAQTEYNPFASIGKSSKVVTLSNGEYKEIYGGDSLKRIGDILFNTKTNKIEKFLEPNDTTYTFNLKKE